MDYQIVVKAVDRIDNQLRKAMEDEFDRFADELWAEECEAEKGATLRAGSGVYQ